MNIPYLDNAATTPVDPRVIEKMLPMLGPDGIFGNPASTTHAYGQRAADAVDAARAEVAALVGAAAREIIFTSGATESDNLALKGVADMHPGGHIVTSAIEHSAVLDTCASLGRHGHAVSHVPPSADGSVAVEAVRDALRDNTCLVSVMHANNETGVITDIAAIAELCGQRGITFHTDAAQSAGKLPLDTRRVAVDLISFTAHKIYGPKGIGALYVRRRPGLELAAQLHGGGHERGLRSGTLASHQIVGFGAACTLMQKEGEAENARIAALRDCLWAGLSALGGIHLNGTATKVPGHLNVAVEGVTGELLLRALAGIAVSSGSACDSASLKPSHVLMAMGLGAERTRASLRFSLGRFTTPTEIETVLRCVTIAVQKLRA